MKNEFEWIAEIRKILGAPSRRVRLGIGDDGAVLRGSRANLVVTVDALVENSHFDFRYSTAEEVGAKALAVNLSDIAAMGAVPQTAVVSVGLPAARAAKILPGLYKGIAKMARHYGVDVVGGNLSHTSGELFVDVTMMGVAKAPLLRSTAKPGDWIGLIGPVGEASAGLALLQKFGRTVARKRWPALCSRQATPTPQTESGIQLGAKRWVHSLIDVSDGLVSELHHLAVQSKVQMELDLAAIPLSAALKKGCETLKRDPLHSALYGGEDYALLFTAPERHAKVLALWGAKRIGVVQPGKPLVWGMREGVRSRLASRGFDHFQPA